MTRPSKVQYTLALVALVLIALALRLGPLFTSPLPFNPDGIVYAGLVRDTIAGGTLPLENLPVDSFLFTLFLSGIELVVDEPARYSSQPVIAIVGTLPTLIAAVFTHRLGGYLEWSLARRRVAGILAGLLLAIDGVYLHRSMPVDEQTIGLLFVPLIAIILARAQNTDRHRWYLLLAVVLASLPPLHNLDSMITLFFLALLLILTPITKRSFRALLVVSVAYIVYFVAYSWGLAAFTEATVIQSQRISYAPGLLLAWVILIGFVVSQFTRFRNSTQRLLLGGALLSFIGLAALNTVQPIFPATRATPVSLLVLVSPLIIPLLVGAWTVPVATLDQPVWAVLLGLVSASFVLIGMALTATLTPEYANTVYRAQTFLHFPIAVFVAVGTTLLVGLTHNRISTPSLHRPVTVGLVALIVLSTAISIPVAFSGLEFLTYKGTTTPGEFAAAEFSATYLNGDWATDDHLSRITRYFEPTANMSTTAARRVAPVYSWFQDGPPPACPTVAQSSWTTTGAQFFPRAPQTLSSQRLGAWKHHASIIYANSAPDPIVIGFPEGNRTHC